MTEGQDLEMPLSKIFVLGCLGSIVLGLMVGAGRFELPTARTPSECATRLRHAPKNQVNYTINRVLGFFWGQDISCLLLHPFQASELPVFMIYLVKLILIFC